MITRLEARKNCDAYIKSYTRLYIRINWWYAKPEPFWFLKIGETIRNPLTRCDEDSGNCVAIGSMNPAVTEKKMLAYARENYNQTDFGMGTYWHWKEWFEGPVGKTESFGNWRKNAHAWEAAEHLAEKFELSIIEASTVRVY
jgi:hypothetical protein